MLVMSVERDHDHNEIWMTVTIAVDPLVTWNEDCRSIGGAILSGLHHARSDFPAYDDIRSAARAVMRMLSGEVDDEVAAVAAIPVRVFLGDSVRAQAVLPLGRLAALIRAAAGDDAAAVQEVAAGIERYVDWEWRAP